MQGIDQVCFSILPTTLPKFQLNLEFSKSFCYYKILSLKIPTFMILRKTFGNYVRTKFYLLERVKVESTGLDKSVKVVNITKTRLLLLKTP